MSSPRALPWHHADPLPLLRRDRSRDTQPLASLWRSMPWPELIWLSFVLVQVLDGVMSYVGVHHIGWM
jgi:hypothetical protein